jgi:hypothetical protein
MPLFETASSSRHAEAEALVNIAPGLFNSLVVGDVVFVAFEENAMEKPIILGKLFRGTDIESNIRGGGGVLESLRVRSAATIPSSTLFKYPTNIKQNYKNLETPKQVADYIKWLERLTKTMANQLEDHFNCFKNWTQWQLAPENMEIDDGDLDILTDKELATPCQYQEEGSTCEVCGRACTKKKNRTYKKIQTDKNYPNI